MSELYLREDLAQAWAGRDPFEAAFSAEGALARDVKQRQTLRTDISGRSYYIKRHGGVGWLEIFKNWLTGKRPVVGAENEYRAALALAAAGLHTLPVAGYGMTGGSPATRRSFLITDDLSPAVSLEDYCLRWPEQPPPVREKRVLIQRLAHIARQMHGLGINHRDFYICHFLLDTRVADMGTAPLHLIDLHRAEMRSSVPVRWLVKDVGGLYFSAFDVGLTRRDVLRFLRAYFDAPLRQVLEKEHEFLRQVDQRAQTLYAKAHARGELPRQVAGLDATKSSLAT